MRPCSSILLYLLIGVFRNCCGLHLEFGRRDPLSICVDDCVNVTLLQSQNARNSTPSILVRIKSLDTNIATVTPTLWLLTNSTSSSLHVEVCGKGGGYTTISAGVRKIPKIPPTYISVIVSRDRILKVIGEVSGWVYFLSWSISYYPQMYTNYSRKSVVGLNFDFVSLNIIGFFLYSMYNCGMYFVSEIRREYFRLHPKGLNPVMLNDVFFSLHAFFATSIITYQCLVYERGTQKVSWVAKFIIFLYAIIFFTSAVLAYTMPSFKWLDFLTYCSYIKLTVTMIKYIPQAIMNYSRKSTVGWSIENVTLDFIGGVFSMLQMAVNSFNYDDWDSISGDVTKFGLGLFSAIFDVFFMYQHYVLYRYPYEEQVNDISASSEQSTETPAAENTERNEERSDGGGAITGVEIQRNE